MPRPFVRSLMTAALVVTAVALAGCTGPGGGGGEQPGAVIDPWLADDIEVNSAVVTGDFMGVALTGFTCDVSQYVSADGDADVVPYASVIITTAGSSLSYSEETLTSTAQGADVPPSGGMPTTVSVTTTRGYWDIGDGGANKEWLPTAELELIAIPIPEDGCTAADLWFTELREAGTGTADIVQAFTEEGLENVAAECPDAWFTWVPPGLSCDEFEALVG